MSRTAKQALIDTLVALANGLLDDLDYPMDFIKTEYWALKFGKPNTEIVDGLLANVEILHNKLACIQALLTVKEQLEKETIVAKGDKANESKSKGAD